MFLNNVLTAGCQINQFKSSGASDIALITSTDRITDSNAQSREISDVLTSLLQTRSAPTLFCRTCDKQLLLRLVRVRSIMQKGNNHSNATRRFGASRLLSSGPRFHSFPCQSSFSNSCDVAFVVVVFFFLKLSFGYCTHPVAAIFRPQSLFFQCPPPRCRPTRAD